jgi:SAM-dependent methyltransferase
MKSIEDFYTRYKIEDFYKSQSNWSKKPIRPFKKSVHKKLSHGIIPGYRNYDLFYERYRSAVEIFKDNQLLKENMKILDVGSGEGFFKFFFDSEYPGKIHWEGIEIWKERAEFCRHIGYTIQEVNLEEGKLPYENKSFDVVLASHVIEHIPNPAEIIKELGRVIRPEGILLIATPTKLPLFAWLDAFFHKMKKSNLGETQQAFTHKSLEKTTLKSLHLPKDSIIDKRGFRILSGRKKLPLENWKWFYNFSKYAGKNMMWFTPEVNLIIRKQENNQ